MWHHISLRNRIYLILALLVFIAAMEGAVMIWYTFRMDKILSQIISRDLVAFQTAEALESALVNQKGFVSYYFLDGNPDWLRQLGEYRQIFKNKLHQARQMTETPEQTTAIEKIETEYNLYITAKDKVIALYQKEKWQQGSQLHSNVRNRFFNILDLCQTYKQIYTSGILQAQKESRAEAVNLRIILGVATLVNFSLALLLAVFLVNHILAPVRKLSLEADREGGLHFPNDEVMALSKSVQGLIEDVDHTYLELEKSREHLIHSEKMAMVGKLAASMAHSIRNPFTSVKMRLFSLGRSMNLSEAQKDDIRVISEEIRHIDNIVQNFLEFSRPPRLKMQLISPSAVVDSAIQLLEHRLKSYNVEVKIIRDTDLPPIQVDPEQLKEAFVNLIINACEAMENGGTIIIIEEVSTETPDKQKVIIRLSDDGPGIPKLIREKLFQPFFSTKEEGTGLGLSVVSRIIHEHDGKIEISSKEGKGTTFVIYFPL
jgi:signal transduction histidine kinase